jgi:hypothetical protein
MLIVYTCVTKCICVCSLLCCCSDLELAAQLQQAAEAADEEGEQASPTDWSLLTPGTKVGAVLQELRVS